MRKEYLGNVGVVEAAIDFIHHEEGGKSVKVGGEDESKSGQRFLSPRQTGDWLENLSRHNAIEHDTAQVGFLDILRQQKRL